MISLLSWSMKPRDKKECLLIRRVWTRYHRSQATRNTPFVQHQGHQYVHIETWQRQNMTVGKVMARIFPWGILGSLTFNSLFCKTLQHGGVSHLIGTMQKSRIKQLICNTDWDRDGDWLLIFAVFFFFFFFFPFRLWLKPLSDVRICEENGGRQTPDIVTQYSPKLQAPSKSVSRTQALLKNSLLWQSKGTCPNGKA